MTYPAYNFVGKYYSIMVFVRNILHNDAAMDDHLLRSFHENYIVGKSTWEIGQNVTSV